MKALVLLLQNIYLHSGLRIVVLVGALLNWICDSAELCRCHLFDVDLIIIL